MPNRTLTINNADGSSETYTINRDKFEGVRSVLVDGATVSVDHTEGPDVRTLTIKGKPPVDSLKEQVYLYGISGQSNGAGRGLVVDAGERFDSLDSPAYIYDRNSSTFEVFDFGVNQGKTGSTSLQFGPESELLRLAAQGGSKVHVVKYTLGGSNLSEQWDSEAGNNLYSTFVSDYLSAQALLEAQGYQVVHMGVLFAQGEKDAYLPSTPDASTYYEDKQSKFVTNLRSDLNLPDLHVSLTLITVKNDLVNSYTKLGAVNLAKTNVANSLSNVSLIDSTNFGFDADNLHYNADGQISHGAAFYDQADSNYTTRTFTIDTTRSPVNSLTVDGQVIIIDRSDEVILPSFIDTFTAPEVAYSLRDLASSTGNTTVVDVRRSTDGRSSSFTASEVDDGTLTAWVGSGNDGYVTKWYDQSGNNNDATQIDEARQPKIVNAGSFSDKGLIFNGTSDYLDMASPLNITTSASIFAVCELNDTAPIQYILDNRDGGSDGSVFYAITGTYRHVWGSQTRLVSSDTSSSILSLTHTGAEVGIGINDGSLVTISNTSVLSVNTTPTIGTRSFSSKNGFLAGEVAELIIYNSDQTANRSALLDDLNAKYSTYI